jgi:hypothetical protein
MTWEGVEGEGQPSPRLASQQLALALDDPERTSPPPVKGGEAAEGNP